MWQNEVEDIPIYTTNNPTSMNMEKVGFMRSTRKVRSLLKNPVEKFMQL